MKMPFGPNKDRELDDLSNNSLGWIIDKMKVEPRPNTPAAKVDEYRMANQRLQSEARRILLERRKNNVFVKDPPRLKVPRERKSPYR